ncbi:MAG: acyl-CoA dehydrogenase [Burkholderiales bacterium]|jgi:alkylation response protein AidB-like acyl-CoA dehydrogenase|uniref:3-methylmercaptopropionyl-CoA dehydrogenase n=1 Tax=Candidatus Desulfobacillus denitrificans TaxID=2608985 RepID=A0A809QYP2_9PROT|nr:acyl-CoA dehydrogenase [Zoogloeaceae bacterium]MBP9653443.1 acyl-CoA dehydrogenase [Rhodocyclaceae bacterium]MCZ2173630.1 acyl-CoA dehydrogenase [Burkholderiales bacterium]OQY74046.1 MAG: acyl-CoA dehydrogenase [Rhodocyclaceae bacterium UTPRO2]BBO20519.1 acyl-CoA dehydrogenase [Candidatus Desulfobacillus denitrificans]GIK46905.1 MAG: acyl-CoA dehydrogenase [Betaproteobacteria bacterium]
MSTYSAPLRDMRFVLRELAGIEQVGKLPGYEEATPDTVDAILEEAAKLSSGVLAPLNVSGDQQGAVWRDGAVTMPKGFKEAYGQFVENGWNGIGCEPEYGGQGMPKVVVAAVQEMWKASNMAFSLCPLLTTGAIEAITLNGSPELKAAYLPKMIEGSWTGTMNLTEPQAGSDLSLVRSRAVPHGDGTYKIFGQKIFITYGEHDMSENIIHLVLARTPDAPEGVKGISLFVVPKFILNADGTPGARNDARCVSIEHKLGIHASPTCVMAYGDHGGATGYLVGKENEGLKYMFVMMNAARFAVGLEGVAIAERAYQQALQYARDRVQGRDLADGSGPVPIVRHPDIRRMLMLMKAQTEAMRALAFVVAAAHDAAARHPDAAERKRNQAFVDLMIPVVKGWSTETGIEIASLGVQIHGGMGFIEETGAAQHLRDARITTIYEGTTGIQANDLIGRKIAREGGATIKAVIGIMKQVEAELAKQPGEEFAAIHAGFSRGVQALAEAATYIATNFSQDILGVHVGAVPFLRLMGIVSGGWQLARAALVAQQKLAAGEGDAGYYKSKISTARFFADHLLSQAPGLAATVVKGGAGALAVAEDCL